MIGLMVWIASMIACVILAASQNRSKFGWFLASVFFGIFAVMVLMLLSPLAVKRTCPECGETVIAQARICRHCGAKI